MPPKAKPIRKKKTKSFDNGFDDADDGTNNSASDIGLDVMSEGDLIEGGSAVSEGELPERKDKLSFEFTDSVGMMRLVRMLICLQVLALINDNPSIQLPIVFRIVCKSLLFYVGRFYSRPVIDLVYLVQYFFASVADIVQHLNLPSKPTSVVFEQPQQPSTPSLPGNTPKPPDTSQVPGSGSVPGAGGGSRLLSASSYIPTPNKAATFAAVVDFTNTRNWHAIKAFSHFFLSALFALIFVLFTVKLWEIYDYTDRKEIRSWVKLHVADGWWRRGLLRFAIAMAQACFWMCIFAFGLFAVARELNSNGMPEPEMIGSALAIVASILFITWIIGYMGIRSAESAFVRYVSQNVSYTSTIILKRVLKAKVDVGLALMFLVYMPSLYCFAQSFFVITDWNDTLAMAHRKSVNYYVPCYFMLFPPLTVPHRNASSCSVDYATSSYQPARAQGFYKDSSILTCDSYLGASFFTAGLFFFVFLLVGYGWLFYSMIQCTKFELQTGRWVGPLVTLIAMRDEKQRDYDNSFNFLQRKLLDISYEVGRQVYYVRQAFVFFFSTIVGFGRGSISMALSPLVCICAPCTFFSQRLFLLFCNSCSMEGRRRALRAAARQKREEALLYDELDQGQDKHDFTGEEWAAGEETLRTIPQMIWDGFVSFLMCINVFKYPYRCCIKLKNDAIYAYHHSESLAWFKVQYRGCMDSIDFWSTTKPKGLAALGAQAGAWRASLTLSARIFKIRQLNERIGEELVNSKAQFIADHSLVITVFDRTVDSSGLFMLIGQYQYHRLSWTMVLWLEMSLYAIAACICNYYMDWQTRIEVVLAINISIGFITYLFCPFAYDTDRWLDFMGRLLVSGTCVGILYCYGAVPAGVNDQAVSASMYTPWKSFSFLSQLSVFGAATYVLVDVAMTLYMYLYILFVLDLVGFFRVLSRKWKSIVFSVHDHILDYLMQVLDKRTLGAENVFTGLTLVQQWDEILNEQRRYALLPWPDVRPPDLVPVTVKIFEIKWASAFNLTLGNLRSSLGLSLLHTSMVAADSELSRWLIHLYPELLNAEDFQNDTPIFIALKECAFFLLRYSEMNGAVLDDGTSYRDEEFSSHYPEMDQYRENAANYGEWLEETVSAPNTCCEVYKLDAFELQALKEKGFFIDTKDTDLKDHKPSFLEFKSKLGKYATQEEIEKEKQEKDKFDAANAVVELTAEQMAEAKKLAARKEQQALAAEKLSMYRKRFPEDDFQDNFESGQMAAWGIVGLTVPNANLFIDKVTYREKGFNEDDEDFDMRYVVPSAKYPIDPVEYSELVQPVPRTHHAIKEMTDWDIIRKKKGRSLLATISDTKQIMNSVGVLMGVAVNHQMKAALDREIRYKMCKFAEIFLSDEIKNNCKAMVWDVTAYKELNKLASREQGRLAQNLATACNLKPPSGFSRISEWTMGVSLNVYDDPPVEDFDPFTLSSVAITDVSSSVSELLVKAASAPFSRGTRRPGQGPASHSSSYNKIGVSPSQTKGFNDRVIHYLAECLVSCKERLDLSDCELSAFGRFGWRAIIRALRRNNCTFIMPSIFVGTKQILTTHLNLSRNELDCGDALLLADAILFKQCLQFLDVSHNRIGARGLTRMCKAMKGHENIKTLLLNHNRIGPSCARELGILMKQNDSIRVLDLSNNRLGELVRYTSLFCRERIQSAARDFFQGLRHNKALMSLNLSNNHLGPICASVVPTAIMRHPSLTILELSGNDLGPDAGAQLIFALAGDAGGEKVIREKEMEERELRQKIREGADIEQYLAEKMEEKKKKEEAEERKRARLKKKNGENAVEKTPEQLAEEEEERRRPAMLSVLHLADNKLGYMSGHALSSLVRNAKTLTSLDVSGNAIGYPGGEAFADGLEKCFGLVPRDFMKKTLFDLEEKKYEGRDAKVRMKIYSNLTNLNLSRCGLGPTCCQGLMYSMGAPNCTITSLDVSENPLGYSIANGGDGTPASNDVRACIGKSRSMTHLNISDASFSAVHLVPIMGGFAHNRALKRIVFENVDLDEPSCLQAAHGMTACPSLRVVIMTYNNMGPKGGLMISNRLPTMCKKLTYLDITGNGIGPISCIPIGMALEDPACSLKTLRVGSNDLMDEGAMFVIRGMKNNTSLTDVDLSDNTLTFAVAEALADVARGYFKDGHKIADCRLKRLVLSENPKFNQHGAILLARALTSPNFEVVEMANCGAGPKTASVIAKAVRDVGLNWKYCDISGNSLSRSGLNEIFWSLRQNRTIRIFLCGDNKAGPNFATDEDNLLRHGVALPRAIRANVIMRELDLSYNGISSGGGINIFEAMIENYTIRRLSLRGNLLDDGVAGALSDFLRYNDVVDDLDLGENKMGFNCCFSIAEGIECNRALRYLSVDKNNLSAAGKATLEVFVRSMMMNTSMRVLVLDGNKLGPEWGMQIADALARNNTYERVSLRDNRLDSRAGEALLKAYENAPFLMELALSADEIGAPLWSAFRRAFIKKRAGVVHEEDEKGGETVIKENLSDILDLYRGWRGDILIH